MNWQYLAITAPAAALLLLAGCTTPPAPVGAKVNLTTTRAADYKGPVQRLAVLANLGSDFNANSTARLKSFMVSKLAACGVGVQFAAVGPDALDGPLPVDMIPYAPDAVLKIRLAADMAAQGNTEYHITVTDTASGKIAWTGDYNVAPGQHEAEVYNRILVDQLVIDHMLPSSCLIPTPLP